MDPIEKIFMNDIWLGIAAQIPVVVAFMIFMIRWQKSQHEANERNHEIWQEWLNRMIEEDRTERNEWREWLRARDERMVRAMTALEKQIQALSNIILAFVSTDDNSGRLVNALKELKDE